jgi:hypothetical protein
MSSCDSVMSGESGDSKEHGGDCVTAFNKSWFIVLLSIINFYFACVDGYVSFEIGQSNRAKASL